MSKRKEDVTCFLCDYWWLFLILFMIIVAALLTLKLWWNPLVPPEMKILGTGDVQATLRWSNTNDLDLHVIDPSGEEIFYQHPNAVSTGSLDVDSNAGCSGNVTSHPVENIFWATNSAPDGHYKVSVHYYKHCTTTNDPIDFSVSVLVNGKEQTFTGKVIAEGDSVNVYEFTP